ncbi:sulfatase-like hydrolase/transferase [Geothrix paludis]|uniref:sulfatase-like hydrolase/transferase n=1 Tax=Geothrix paludis TaxID=2922722 RepID=UPI001FACE5CB|nr:sulfatase-like hydrolase/transferase [Geothrix paludis]
MPVPGVPPSGMKMRLLLSFSAANLLLFRCWQALLPGSTDQYFGAWNPTITSVAALLFLVTTATIAIYILSWIVYKKARLSGLPRSGFHVLALVILQHPIRETLTGSYSHLNLFILKSLIGRPVFYTVSLTLVVVAFFLIHRWPSQAEHLSRSALLLLLPLPLLCLGSILLQVRPGDGVVPQVTALAPGPPPARQLYLIVFDEWDYGWTFAHRPESLLLPHLDAFAKESFQTQRAYPPASETKRSIPSILSGRLFSEVATEPDCELSFKDAESGQRYRLSELEDLPLLASRQGKRTLLIDYYHAYGKRYQSQRKTLELCRLPYYAEWEKAERSQGHFPAAVKFELSLAIESLPGLKGLLKDLELPHLRELHSNLLNRLLEEASRPTHELVIVHLPVPHAPCLTPPSECGFHPGSLGNLRLVDEAIGALRNRLEERRAWNDSTIILTSDHWQRAITAEGLPPRPPAFSAPEFAHRIPLLMKFAGPSAERHNDTPMNNRVIHPLVKDWLFDAELTSDRVAQWAGTFPPRGAYDPLIK